MVETRDLVQLRQLSLELLGQLWAGQEAVRRSVAKAASASNLDSSSSYDSETPSSQEMSSAAPRTSCPEDAHQDSNDPELSAELDGLPQEVQALRSVPDQQSKLPKPRVTFKKESPVPEGVWRFRPYLGYDWIAGSLDSSSPVTSKPEAFFSKLQKFREANKEECICSEPDPQVLSLHENGGVEGDHECVYCYRVSRRLFLVPSDPGSPCRLCRVPRGQRGPETLAEPAQVRVSVPLSILDPPHQYRIHRRKSFDASDTLALPRHCLLGWDILPPKAEKSSAPESLGLWSCVSSKAQHRKLSAASPSCLALPTRVPPPTPIWSESQVPRACTPELKP